MTPRTITGAHRIYILPKERNKSEYVDYCAQSTTLVEALTKDSLVEHLIIKCSDPWGFVFPEQLVSQEEREKPLRITLLLTEHIDHVRGNLPRWEEFIARAREGGKLKGQVYKSGWQDCVVPRGVYVPSGLMTRIACRDKGKYASNFPDPTGRGSQENDFTYRFLTDASLATDSTAEELAQIRAYFGVDLSHPFKPIRKIKNGIVTNTQADMWVYEFLYARQVVEAHGAASGIYMNMLYWLNASEANVTDFWEVAETTEDTANKIEDKLDKPTNGSYVLDSEMPDLIKDKIKGDTELQELIKGRDGKDGRDGTNGRDGRNPDPSEVAELIATDHTYRDRIREGLLDENQVKELARTLDEERKVGGRNLIVTKRWEAGYLYGDSTNGNPGEPEYKVIPNFHTYRYDPTYIPTEGNTIITYKLYDNGGDKNGVIQLHAYDKDKKFLWWDFDGWRGEIGRTRTYTLPTDTRYIRLGVTNEKVRAKVEFGNVATDWTPAPEDLLGALDSAKLELKNELSGKASISEVDGLRNYVVQNSYEIRDAFQSLRAKDKSLEAKQMQDDERKWLRGVMRKLIPSDIDPDAFANGKFVSMSSDLSLRSSNGSPTAILGGSSNKKKALLLAGVSGYGTNNQTEQTAIYEDGSAKFGEVSIKNDRIQLKGKKGEPLALTADEAVFVKDVVRLGKINEDSFSIRDVAITNSSSGVKLGDFTVANDGTKVTIDIGKLTSEVYTQGKSMLLMLDADILGSWSGKTELVDTGGGAFGKPNFSIEKTPLVAQNLTWERYLNKGSHTLLAIIYSNVNTDKGSIEGLNVHQSYDASKRQTLISQSGVRAYGGSARYFDVDARTIVKLANGNVIQNYYVARVKGGMLVDSLELEKPLDAPGCVLAGGEVDSNGQVTKSFGRYKKKQGDNTPSTKFDYNTHYYTVYHSINNTNYIPIVTSRSSAWADVPRVMSVSSNSFTIAFINETNKVSDWRQPFIYTCYKAD